VKKRPDKRISLAKVQKAVQEHMERVANKPNSKRVSSVNVIQEMELDKESESEFSIRLKPSQRKITSKKLSPLRLNIKAISGLNIKK